MSYKKDKKDRVLRIATKAQLSLIQPTTKKNIVIKKQAEKRSAKTIKPWQQQKATDDTRHNLSLQTAPYRRSFLLPPSPVTHTGISPNPLPKPNFCFPNGRF